MRGRQKSVISGNDEPRSQGPFQRGKTFLAVKAWDRGWTDYINTISLLAERIYSIV